MSGGSDGSPVDVFKPNCDENIFLLIKRSKNHSNALAQSIKELGHVELYQSPADGCLVRFTRDKVKTYDIYFNFILSIDCYTESQQYQSNVSQTHLTLFCQ